MANAVDYDPTRGPQPLVTGPMPTQPEASRVRVEVESRGEETDAQKDSREQKEADAALIERAKRDHAASDESEGELRQKMLLDRKYRAGEQWPLALRTAREQDGRPCLTINKLPQFLNQVVNQLRQSRPSIQVVPVDANEDIETANVIQSLIRDIETQSQAEHAYSHACTDQVELGRGWWKIVAEYQDDSEGLEQELRIRRVRNPFTIYPDPTCQEPTYEDARFLHEITDFNKDDFRLEFGDDAADGLAQFETLGINAPGWLDKNRVRVNKYWWVETTKDTAYFDQAGAKTMASEADPDVLAKAIAAGVFVKNRPTIKRRVRWAVLTAAQVLDRGEWPGKWIPYIPVLGDEIDIEGKVDLQGMVRTGKESQTRYNVQVSAETEAIGLAPKAPFVGYKGQFTDPKWAEANRRNFPFLEADLLDINGERLPLPQRNVAEPPIQAIAMSISQADNDLRATTGYFDIDPMSNAQARESGKARLVRQQQGDTGNSHYGDNLGTAIRFTGRQMVNLLPKYMDTARIKRITGLDEKQKTVMIHAGKDNAPPVDPATGKPQLPPGVDKIFDIGTGRYDVRIKMGRNFLTDREAQNDMFGAIAQAAPQLVPRYADLWVKTNDAPGNQEVAERLIPPDIKAQEGQNKDIPPQAQAMIQAAQQLIPVMQARIAELEDAARTKSAELASKEYIATLQARVTALTELAKLNQAAGAVALQAEYDRIGRMLDMNTQRIAAEQQQAIEQAQPHPMPGQPGPGPAGQTPPSAPGIGNPGVPPISPIASAPAPGTPGAPPGA